MKSIIEIEGKKVGIGQPCFIIGEIGSNHCLDKKVVKDLINASDLVVSKCGYGMISECLSAGTPFQLVADENHPEQHAIINALDRYGMKNLISNWENGHIEIDFNTLKYFESFKNDNLNVKNIIMEFLK